jgi:GT2 family glycosyltransferase
MVTVIVPVRNDATSLARCLASILRHLPSNTDIVVADNGSTDASVAAARAAGARVVLAPGVRVGEVRNRGAHGARGSLLAFVDADHELGAGWIEAAIETVSDPNVAAVGFDYCPPLHATWVQRIYNAFRAHPTGIRRTDWIGAGNLVVKTDAFAAVGGFDASLEACEDVDFCQRLSAAGFILMSDSRMRSVHHGDPRSLAALFRSELWRGRNNLRVSLRGNRLANLPSIAVPIVELLALLLLVVGAASRSWWAALSGVALLIGPIALRAVRLFSRLISPTLLDAAQALAVAATYDLARALALVTRTPHRRSGGKTTTSA